MSGFLTSLQPVIPLFAVRHQGSWGPQALLAEHLVALAGGQEEDDHPNQQHTAQYTYQPPPHSGATKQVRQWDGEKQAGQRKDGEKRVREKGDAELCPNNASCNQQRNDDWSEGRERNRGLVLILRGTVKAIVLKHVTFLIL